MRAACACRSQSLLTVLLGGISFETPPDAVQLPAGAANAEFPLFDNRTKAFRPRETVDRDLS